MTATDELRRLLDERGVEYSECADVFARETYWQDETRKPYRASESVDNGGELTVRHLTPEQAIAATLGGGKLTAEQVREVVEEHTHDFGNDWQAIADELNATLGSGICRMEQIPECQYDDIACSECGVALWAFSMDKEGEGVLATPNYCPYCGKAVKR